MTLDLPGFADPVTDAQICFRALLDGLSRPGSLRELSLGLTPPAPLGAAAAAALLTLVDGETPLWLDQRLARCWDWLAFHCGAEPAGDIGEATFVGAMSMPDLASLAPGSDAEPEASATLILEVAALSRGRPYRLAGPGLKNPTRIEIAGLPLDFAAQWAANHALFPRGVDLVLCAGKQFCALPRSVRIEEI
jgi:alpha-D-ribose 1-methylphosphonate 5-triphosphate synthase subunit PhnH